VTDIGRTGDDRHLAHAKTYNLAPNIDYRQGVGEALPFTDASFDKVVSVSSVEHFQDPVKGFAEMYRVLCFGGRMAVSVDTLTPENSSDRFRSWHKKRHYVTTYFRRMKPLNSLTRSLRVEPARLCNLFRSMIATCARNLHPTSASTSTAVPTLPRIGRDWRLEQGRTYGQIIVLVSDETSVGGGSVVSVLVWGLGDVALARWTVHNGSRAGYSA
jgi:SAM-dependent methyltransferase